MESDREGQDERWDGQGLEAWQEAQEWSWAGAADGVEDMVEDMVEDWWRDWAVDGLYIPTPYCNWCEAFDEVVISG